MTKEEFLAPFCGLCEVYNKPTPSDAYMNLYFRVVEDLTAAEFEQAVTEILRTRKYTNMPAPGEIIEFARGNPEDAAILAIDKLEEAMRTVGAYESVKFDDPALMVLVEGQEGGWPGLCAITLDEWRFKKPQLIKAYKAYQQTRRTPKHTHLPGITERDNQGRYLDHIPKPVEIGDTVKPLEIEK